MAHFQGVLFDLDGTLLNSLEDLAESMNSVLGRMGFPGHPIEAYKDFVGDGIEILAHRVLPPERLEQETVARAVALMRREYSQRWARKTKPYDGIPELLQALTDRSMAKGILSNKPDDFTQKIVRALLADWRFDVVRGARENIPKKPDPTGAIQLAAELDIRPQHFLYVGDTNTDMRTAHAAGMFAVGALWGFRTAQELRENGAQTLIATPGELLGFL